MNTKSVLLLVAIALAALVAWGVYASATAGVPVSVAEVTQGTIRELIDERGTTRLPETYLITMPAPGRIEAITLDEGDRVSQGEVVARIVARDLELAVEQAAAAVERLKARIRENADVRVERTVHEQAGQFVKSMQQTVKAAKARVEAGAAKYDYAEKDLGRIRQLAATGARTQDDLDRAVVREVGAKVDYQQDQLVYAAMVALEAATDLLPTIVEQYIDRKQLTEEVLQKELAEAEAKLEQVRREQQRGVMRSPVDGVVLEKSISNERFLPAGEVLLKIGRLEELEVEADVLSVDVVAAAVGDPVEIYGPAIGQPAAKGRVARIFPAGFTKISSLGVEQQRVRVIIDFAADDLRRLLEQRHLEVGYRVRVRIITAEKSGALMVPRSALFRGSSDLRANDAAESSWQVFTVRGGRARRTQVTVGLTNDEHVEILEGLKQGDQVIQAPESNLSDGARVEIRG